MKRRLAAAVLAGSLVFNAGCGAIRNDLRHPGGYPGRQMDKRTFDASQSKQLQLLRATLVIAIAARIGEQSVSPEDADVFARQLAEAAREVNYAAADAGFGDGDNPTCAIGSGFSDANSPGWGVRSDYEPDNVEECAGYYVNFESHVTRIEGRVIRAMLTSLPTDKARAFLNDLGKGDMLSALWRLSQSFTDLASAFHNAAGVYRSGTETMAALMDKPCVGDPSYAGPTPAGFDEEWGTVLHAAQCLGLSRSNLFDADTAMADSFPVKLPPRGFHALFRIARTACVALPLQNSTEFDFVVQSRRDRQKSCEIIRFSPQMRPLDVTSISEGEAEDEQVPEVSRGPASEALPLPRDILAETRQRAGRVEDRVPSVPPPPP